MGKKFKQPKDSVEVAGKSEPKKDLKKPMKLDKKKNIFQAKKLKKLNKTGVLPQKKDDNTKSKNEEKKPFIQKNDTDKVKEENNAKNELIGTKKLKKLNKNAGEKPQTKEDKPDSKDEKKKPVIKKDGLKVDLKSEIEKAKEFANKKEELDNSLYKIIKKEENNAENVNVTDDLIPSEKIKFFTDNFIKLYDHLMNKYKKENPLELSNPKIKIEILGIRIPMCVDQSMNIVLPKPIFTKENEICLFVPDLDHSSKDFDSTIEHYENLLSQNGIDYINKVITFNQIRFEYPTYELRRRLANTYDLFLVHHSIASFLGKILGKVFKRDNKNPIKIQDFTKNGFDESFRTVNYKIINHGSHTSMDIGMRHMTPSDIAKNLAYSINWMKTNYPGGWRNIRCLTMRSHRDIQYPIYINYGDPNQVEVPVLISRRTQKIEKNKKKIEGLLDFSVTKLGNIVEKVSNKVTNKQNGARKKNIKAEKKKKDDSVEQEPEVKKLKTENTSTDTITEVKNEKPKKNKFKPQNKKQINVKEEEVEHEPEVKKLKTESTSLDEKPKQTNHQNKKKNKKQKIN